MPPHSSLPASGSESSPDLPVICAGRALAATVSGRQERARDHYVEALKNGASENWLAEVARMAHLLGGFPRALQGLASLAEARQAAGRPPDLPADSTTDRGADRNGDREADGRRGRLTFEKIYGAQANPVLERVRDLLPGFERWILEDAYGRVLSRPGISLAHRELLVVAALSVLDCPDQLRSHARGALRCGATWPAVRQMIEGLAEDFGVELSRQALASIEPVSPDSIGE